MPAPAPTILFNPQAGQAERHRRTSRLERALRAEGLPEQWIEVTADHRIDEILRQDEGRGPVVVIGGDGTLQTASKVLCGTGRPLVIVPAGTGNVMALRLGLPMGLRPALRLVREGIPRRVDVGRCGEEPFLLAVGGGFEGQVIREADRQLKSRLGKSAYFWSAARHLPIHHHDFTVEVDGEVFEENAASVMVANYGTQMGTWIFPPEASGDDGLLDVAVLKAQTFDQVVTLVAASLGAPPREGGGLTLRRGRKVKVRCGQKVPIQLDGDDQGDATEFEAEIVPGALTVLVPRKPQPFHPVWLPPLDWG